MLMFLAIFISANWTVYFLTDLTITTEKLMELFAPLDPEKVDMLGGEHYLGLPQSEIDRLLG